jgi:putative transposase
MLTNLKKEYRWLCDVSSVPLQQALRNLDCAFVNFFEGRAKYPVVSLLTADGKIKAKSV